jgi:hypothetical protein
LRCDAGLVFVMACERINLIQFQGDWNNNPFVDPYALLLVRPHELVKTMTSNFLRKMCQHGYWL